MMKSAISSRRVTTTGFAISFITFGILTLTAFLAAEYWQILEPPEYLASTKILEWYRTIYTAWATIILLTPALCFYVLQFPIPAVYPYWRLLWIFSYLAYAVHAGWAIFVFFEGDFNEIFDSPMVSSPRFNFFLTFWWSLDIALLWFVRSDSKWVKTQRSALHLLVLVAFFIASVVQGTGWVRGLGIAMAACVLLCSVIGLSLKARDKDIELQKT